MINANVYGFPSTRTQDEIQQMSILHLRSDLFLWYSTQKAGITKLEDLSVGMLGTKDSPKLATKAAETKHLCPFCVDLLQRFQDKVPRGAVLLELGLCVLKLIDLMDESPVRVEPGVWQEPCLSNSSIEPKW